MITDDDIFEAYIKKNFSNHNFWGNPRIAFTMGARWMQEKMTDAALIENAINHILEYFRYVDFFKYFGEEKDGMKYFEKTRFIEDMKDELKGGKK